MCASRSVKPGGRVLIADGSLAIEVSAVLSATELRGRCLNAKSLGATKNVNLPGEAQGRRASEAPAPAGASRGCPLWR